MIYGYIISRGLMVLFGLKLIKISSQRGIDEEIKKMTRSTERILSVGQQ